VHTTCVCVQTGGKREKENARKREKERSAGLITRAGQRVAPMVTIEQVSMLLRESTRKKGDEWFLHPHFNHIYTEMAELAAAELLLEAVR
jgi:hypothetical protein